MSAQISKEVKDLARQEWFPIFMRELGYEAVVRCGECEYFSEFGNGSAWCAFHETDLMFSDDYCSSGERRADDSIDDAVADLPAEAFYDKNWNRRTDK